MKREKKRKKEGMRMEGFESEIVESLFFNFIFFYNETRKIILKGFLMRKQE